MESVDFVELGLQKLDEVCFVVVGPCFSFAVLAVDVRFLEGPFKVIIGDVVPIIVLDERLLELLAEPGEAELAVHKWSGVWQSTNFILC